jgi:hypothetical protein
MSDNIKHECGIAMLRLRKPMEYYIKKYGIWNYGLQKMYLMMEKQHNRGQDGAGIAGIKLESLRETGIFSDKDQIRLTQLKRYSVLYIRILMH